MRVDGGFEEKEDLKKEVEVEPKKKPDEGDDQSSVIISFYKEGVGQLVLHFE